VSIPQTTLVACPYCGVSVSQRHIDVHKRDRCPKAPNEIVAARLPKRKPGRKIPHIYLPDDPAIHNSTKPQDRQINPSARTTRMEDGSFIVVDLLQTGGSWTCHLSTECSYCHCTIEVRAVGRSNMAKYARDEACRLALLEHLRTDHASSATTRKKMATEVTVITKADQILGTEGPQVPRKVLKNGTVLVGSETGQPQYFRSPLSVSGRRRRKASRRSTQGAKSTMSSTSDPETSVICPVCNGWFKPRDFGPHVRSNHPEMAKKSWMQGY
jgi:hypothetical protein